jgi:hypothetical protein
MVAQDQDEPSKKSDFDRKEEFGYQVCYDDGAKSGQGRRQLNGEIGYAPENDGECGTHPVVKRRLSGRISAFKGEDKRASLDDIEHIKALLGLIAVIDIERCGQPKDGHEAVAHEQHEEDFSSGHRHVSGDCSSIR